MRLPPGAVGNVPDVRDAGDEAATATGTIDLMSVPRMPRAAAVSPEAARLCYEAPGDPARALIFCAAVLHDRGWSETREAGLRFVSGIFATALFERSGYSIAFSARPTPGKPRMVTVTLQEMGNLDTRTLARQPDATLIWSARVSTTYVTKSNVRAAADFTRNALADLGWRDYALVESRHDERHENQTFTFAKEGLCLTVRVTLGLTRRDRTLVQYNTSILGGGQSAPTSGVRGSIGAHPR
jgi:hypothetical protein